MKNMTKNTMMIMVGLGLLWSSMSFAGGMQYDMRVDGLACPFCAYGIEKKFTKTEGVNKVEVDLEKGLVIINTDESKTFSDDELKGLIHDSGFTMKSVTHKEL